MNVKTKRLKWSMPLLNLNWVGYMVTYIKNGKNCWDILRALST